MTTGPTAFLDASVIYPAGIHNLLMYMQLAGTFRATWSDMVHEEWITALLRKRPHLTRAQLERTRDLMNQHAVGATVTGYEGLIDGLRLPDANDRHVLAAAITAGASIIVTSNLKHFPASALAPRGIEALHPDDFAFRLFAAAPADVLVAARMHRRSLKSPPKPVADYLAGLEKSGFTDTVAALRPFGGLLE
jgi:predicted nucleic acid-binding protein